MEPGVGRCDSSEEVGAEAGEILPCLSLASGGPRTLGIPCLMAASLHPRLHGHVASSLCICVLSSFSRDTTHRIEGSFYMQYDNHLEILNGLHLRRPCFQIRSHSEVLGGHDIFGDTIQPTLGVKEAEEAMLSIRMRGTGARGLAVDNFELIRLWSTLVFKL